MTKHSCKHLGFAFMGLLASVVSYAVDIEPPKVQLVDKFGVNMANGQVTQSQELLSIGGAMGLSDSISVHANEFDYKGYRGFQHKFYAQARDVNLSNAIDFSPRNIMRVYDFSGSADFAYYIGATQQLNGSATSGYSYRPLGDQRHSLKVNGNYLEWTKPDGTLVLFDRGPAPTKPASHGGVLISIKYPNGFTITVIGGGVNVLTNTGFQLKQIFEADTRPMGKTDIPSIPGSPMSSAASGWSYRNPKYILGINAAIEHCATNANSCSASHDWPRAIIEWPPGMPRTMYIDSSDVKVTNAQGVTTTYRFTAYDLAYVDFDHGTIAEGQTPRTRFSPRLTAVLAAGGGTIVTYDYKNLFSPSPNGAYDLRLQDAGVITEGSRQGLTTIYDMLRPYYDDMENVAGGGRNGVSSVQIKGKVNGVVGAIDHARTDDGRITFEGNPRNFPAAYYKNTAPDESYGYDARGNLTSIDYTPGTAVIAEYPSSCPEVPTKTCNQATRIRDANGGWTDYAYHEPSGQVRKVTYPANKHGTRPETRYEYTELRASYYDSMGARITGTPIWMKTAEKYCINSVANNDVCAAGDEVITRFEYEHPNLLMTGMTVTDPQTGQTLRTCFQYDIYGNQIGKTSPKANMSTCP